MTKKLEEVFGFPPIEDASTTLDAQENQVPEEIQEELNVAHATIDMANRVDIALQIGRAHV